MEEWCLWLVWKKCFEMKWWALKIEFRECAASLPFFFFAGGEEWRTSALCCQIATKDSVGASEWREPETTHNYSLVTMNMRAPSHPHAQISNVITRTPANDSCFFPCSHSSHLWTFYHITNPHRLCPTVRASFSLCPPPPWPLSQMLLTQFQTWKHLETRGTKRMWNLGLAFFSKKKSKFKQIAYKSNSGK